MTFPCTLGLFTGNPGDGNAVAQYNDFVALVGATPAVINVYIDGSVNPDTWEGSVGYWIGEWTSNAPWNAGAATARTVVPMWGMPMGSYDTTYAPTEILQRYIAGTYDGYLQAVVSQSAAAGYKTILCRPGVEMNLSTTPGFAVWVSDPALFIQAFQHIYTVLHAAFAQYGINGRVIWNPGCCSDTSAGNATVTLYPGDGYCDIIGGDFYGDTQYAFGGITQAELIANPTYLADYYTNPAMNSLTQPLVDASGGICLSVSGLAAFARARGKPFALPEVGAGGTAPLDNPVFWTWLRSTLDAHVEAGGTVAVVSMWDSNDPEPYQFTGGQQPLASAAIAANFGVNAPAVPGSAPVVTPPPAPAKFTASPPNTQVNGTTGSITDTSGNVWTITSGQQIARNGVVVPSSAGVVTLFWTGAALLQFNTKGAWWTQPLTGGAGVSATAPAGYAAPAKFTVSPANTQVNGTAGSITDTLGNVWTINASQHLVWNTTVQNTKYTWATLFWTGSALYVLSPANTWTLVNLTTLKGTAAHAPAGYVAG